MEVSQLLEDLTYISISIFVVFSIFCITGQLFEYSLLINLDKKICYSEFVLIIYILSKHIELSHFAFGNLLYNSLLTMNQIYSTPNAYCYTCIALSIASCLIIELRNRHLYFLNFEVFTRYLILGYFMGIQNFGYYTLALAAIFPFAYVIAFRIGCKDFIRSSYQSRMRNDLVICCLWFIAGGVAYQVLPYVDIQRLCICFGECSFVILLGDYFEFFRNLFGFYIMYMHRRIAGKEDYVGFLKGIIYVIGIFLGLFVIEIAIFQQYSALGPLYFILFVHGYSNIMLICYAVFHKLPNAFQKKYKIASFAQVFFIKCTWTWISQIIH